MKESDLQKLRNHLIMGVQRELSLQAHDLEGRPEKGKLIIQNPQSAGESHRGRTLSAAEA